MAEDVGEVDGLVRAYLEEGRSGRGKGGYGRDESVGHGWQDGFESFQNEWLDVCVFVINQSIEPRTWRLPDRHKRSILLCGRPTVGKHQHAQMLNRTEKKFHPKRWLA